MSNYQKKYAPIYSSTGPQCPLKAQGHFRDNVVKLQWANNMLYQCCRPSLWSPWHPTKSSVYVSVVYVLCVLCVCVCVCVCVCERRERDSTVCLIHSKYLVLVCDWFDSFFDDKARLRCCVKRVSKELSVYSICYLSNNLERETLRTNKPMLEFLQRTFFDF